MGKDCCSVDKKEVKQDTKVDGLLKSVIGLSMEEAIAMVKSADMKPCVGVDGEVCHMTCDFLLDRVNLQVKGGKVVKAHLG